MSRDVIGIPDAGDVDDGVLAAYLDGALTDVERVRLESRLARDPALARRLDDERAVRARAASLLDALDLPAGRAAASDIDHVRARAAASARADAATRARRGPRLLPFAWAATVVMALGVGALWNASRREQRSAPLVAGATAGRATTRVGAPALDPNVADARTEARSGTSPVNAAAAREDDMPTPQRRGASGDRPIVADAGVPRAAAPTAAARVLQQASGAVTVTGAVASSGTSGRTDDATRVRGTDAATTPPRPASEAEAFAAPLAAPVTSPVPAPSSAPTAASMMASRASDMVGGGASGRATPPRPIDLRDAATLLGTAPRIVRDAAVIGVAAVDPREWDGARTDRPVVHVRQRDAAGRAIGVVQQRAADDDRADPRLGWRVLGPVRLRLVGEFSPATADSLWRRIEP